MTDEPRNVVGVSEEAEPSHADYDADTPLKGDYLVRGMALDASIRALAVRSTHLCQELMDRHQTMPTAAAAVCRVASGCLLLGGTVKGRSQVGIEVKGDGPLEYLYGVADAHGHVRVTIRQPLVDLPPRSDGKFNVASAVGMGRLTVMKNLGMKGPYQGVVPLVSGEIARDLVEYFHSSEQLPSAMALGERLDVNSVSAAGGYLIQAFPDAPDESLAELEHALRDQQPISRIIEDGGTPHEILQQLLPDVEFLEAYPTSFRCSCSRGRYEQALVSLGEGELTDIIEEDGQAELRCHFCNQTYVFNEAELRYLLASAMSSVN